MVRLRRCSQLVETRLETRVVQPHIKFSLPKIAFECTTARNIYWHLEVVIARKIRSKTEIRLERLDRPEKFVCEVLKSPGKIRSKAHDMPPISLATFPAKPGSSEPKSPGKMQKCMVNRSEFLLRASKNGLEFRNLRIQNRIQCRQQNADHSH